MSPVPATVPADALLRTKYFQNDYSFFLLLVSVHHSAIRPTDPRLSAPAQRRDRRSQSSRCPGSTRVAEGRRSPSGEGRRGGTIGGCGFIGFGGSGFVFIHSFPVAWSCQWHSSMPAATTTEFQPCVITHASENGVATAAGAVRAIAANAKAPAASTEQNARIAWFDLPYAGPAVVGYVDQTRTVVNSEEAGAGPEYPGTSNRPQRTGASQ
jgi:hypothetical protein